MKINIVKICNKYAVMERPFFGRPFFYSKNGDYTWRDNDHIFEYFLFDTEAEAQKVYDIVTAIKNPEVVR